MNHDPRGPELDGLRRIETAPSRLQRARRPVAMTALGLMLGVGWVGACSVSSGGDPGTLIGSGGAGGEGTSIGGAGGDPLTFDAGDPDAQQDACAATVAEATVVYKPVDIIFVIDNSGSMGTEASGVESNINDSFATIIGNANIDYQVIMLTDHGAGNTQICIVPPLASTGAGIGCSALPGHNPPTFSHYDRNVNSVDSLCRIFHDFSVSDTNGFPAGGGYEQLLRDDAHKIFVVVTDEGDQCSVTVPNYGTLSVDSYHELEQAGIDSANDFDDALLAMSPLHFGTAQDRNYSFYGIIGLGEKAGTPEDPYLPTEPIVHTQCSSAWTPGYTYQHLAVMTEGLRFPVCLADQGVGYANVFEAIAQGVVQGAAAPCEFEMPEPPPGEELDPDTLEVNYTPGTTGVSETFEQVANLVACGASDDKFYVEDDTIKLCPAACTVVEDDPDAVIEILLGCGVPPR